jgi:molybdenum cofactor guanylyltransferase
MNTEFAGLGALRAQRTERTENHRMSASDSELKVGGYILAGGGSTRFGRDKALAELGGLPMLGRMIALLQIVVKNVKVVVAPEKYAKFEIEMISDQWPGEGPLGGIITALEHAARDPTYCEWNLILSCDMPFLTSEWLTFLCERAAKSKAQVLVPHSKHGPEPLCACYRTNAAAALRAAFELGVRKVTHGLQHVSTEVLDEADWKRFDSAGRLFWNMNRAADYEEAQRILEAERM